MIQSKEKAESIKKEAEELERTIKDATKALDDLQKTCSHPDEYIKIKDINPENATELRKVCDTCGHVLGYPSKEELEIWTGSKETDRKE